MSSSVQENNSLKGTWTFMGLDQRLVIAMVGLPARGKSHIVKMVMRYLKWTGFDCEVFNVGSYRRTIGLASADSSFFSSENKDAKRFRDEMAVAVQDIMYRWLHDPAQEKGRVAIFDATNTSRSRRLTLSQRARQEGSLLLFVESICDDKGVLEQNYRLKLHNEDYKDMDPERALADFQARVEAYEKIYQTIEDDEDNGNVAYIKLINVGQKTATRQCSGYLPSQVAFYLQNIHIQPRKIYLSINGDNNDRFEDEGRLSGKAKFVNLTEAGLQYSRDLAAYLKSQHRAEAGDKNLGDELLILTGTAKIHADTVKPLKESFPCYHMPLLNDLRWGDLHNLSNEEIKERYPNEYAKMKADRLQYRYPGVGGESYLDVIERIRPVIIELERQRRSVLVVCHRAVVRCIHAYFMDTSLEETPIMPFKRHIIYELSIGPLGCTCREIDPSVGESDIEAAEKLQNAIKDVNQLNVVPACST
jgi:broad specificity phosphatase PhoE/predicted kinase